MFSKNLTELESKGTWVSWKGPNITSASKSSEAALASFLLIDESRVISPVWASYTSLWVITTNVTLSPLSLCFFKVPKHPNSISSGWAPIANTFFFIIYLIL